MSIKTRMSSKCESPKLTIIITAYNRKDYVSQAIDSVLNQTLNHRFYQIVVVCNFEGKTMSTNQGIEKMNQCEFLYLGNGTIGEFLTEAVIHSRGEVITFLDDDDLFSENKLERIKNIFDEYPNLSYYHNSAHVFKDRVELTKETCDLETQTHLDFVSAQYPLKRITKFMRSGGCFNMSSISIKRTVLLSSLNALRQIENDQDLFMLMIALQNGSLAARDTAELTYYRKGVSTSFPVEEIRGKLSVKCRLFEKAYYSNLVILNALSDEKLRRIILRNLVKIENIFSFCSDEKRKKSLKLTIKFLARVLLDLDTYYLSLFLVAVLNRNRFFSKVLQFGWHN